MKKLFISQPMNGKSNEEILTVRAIAKRNAELILHEEVTVIDSFFEDAPVNAKPLWYLGKSLELLANADIAYFAAGWEEARGCKIEHECAVQYGISIMDDFKVTVDEENTVSITREQYAAIAQEVIIEEVNSPGLEGAGRLLIPMVGGIFMSKVERKLFGQKEVR